MSKTQGLQFLEELEQEAKATKKILEAVPFDQLSFKPHEKSMELGRLATHVAEIPGWFYNTVEKDELDFTKSEFKPLEPKNNAELVAFFEENLAQAKSILQNVSNEELAKDWTMRSGEQIFFTLPKGEVVRTWCLNHWYHHRAQLGVYLRLLNVPVPGTYGPSADFS